MSNKNQNLKSSKLQSIKQAQTQAQTQIKVKPIESKLDNENTTNYTTSKSNFTKIERVGTK